MKSLDEIKEYKNTIAELKVTLNGIMISLEKNDDDTLKTNTDLRYRKISHNSRY